MRKEAPERYLEVIYDLSKHSTDVKSIDVSKNLAVQRAEVFRAVKALKIFGYIEQTKYGRLVLTEKGKEKAKALENIHDTISAYLTATIGLSKEEADSNSYKIEHLLSNNAIKKIVEFMSDKKINEN